MSLKIIIQNKTLPSWNTLYSGKHWSVRKKMADEWHEVVQRTLQKAKPKLEIFTAPVSINITCYFKGRTLDPDNICAKLAIDGLKGIVIEDDTPKFITKVCTQSKKDKEHPRTEITIL